MIQAHKILARPGLRKVFDESMKNWVPIYSQWVNVGTTDDPEVSNAAVTGPSRLIESGELEPVTYMRIVSGQKRSAVVKLYKGGYFLSKEAIDDEKGYGKLNTGAKWLAKAAQFTREYACQAILDDAFTGTYFKGRDGLKLFSTAHTLLNAGSSTVSNTPATAVGLSVAGFTAMQDLARKMKDENGDPMMVSPDSLMIANDQGQVNKAYQLLESQLEPFTANNQDNPVKRNFKPKKIIINPYATTNLYHWFMFDSSENDMSLLDKEKINMRDWYDEENDASKVRARNRFILWFYNYKGWYGTDASA